MDVSIRQRLVSTAQMLMLYPKTLAFVPVGEIRDKVQGDTEKVCYMRLKGRQGRGVKEGPVLCAHVPVGIEQEQSELFYKGMNQS